jgi:site-specific recombinase XerD
MKWLRGLRWEEIDDNLILRHVTSKRGKEIEIDLHNAPLVMAELERLGTRPASGPVIIHANVGVPYKAMTFRYLWRKLATEAGIPKTVRNMDTRAGAITEALQAGANLEDVRKAATHSDTSMTVRYSRGDQQAVAEVMQLRAKNANKTGTES